MKKGIFLCYFASVATLLAFTTSLMMNWIVISIICGILFAGCLVWFCKMMENGEKWVYRRIRRMEKRLYDGIDEEFKAIRKELDGKADKKVDISNVRPGSRPSIAYQNMVVAKREGEALDGGRED